MPSSPSGVYLVPSFGTYCSVASFCLILCFNFCVFHKWLHFLILEKRSDIEDSLRAQQCTPLGSELYSLGVPYVDSLGPLCYGETTIMVGLAPNPVGYQALSPVEAATHWWKWL